MSTRREDEIMNLTGERLLDLILKIILRETGKTGLSRERCEELIFNSISVRCFSEQEKAFYMRLLKVVLDRAFPA
jgi:hypothetical protein